jgi:cell division protein ZapA
MEHLLPISIVIADRSYRIKVELHEEEDVRRTVKYINDKISEFKLQFAGKDMQDYVAMVLIWYATQPAGALQRELADDDLRQGLGKLQSLIEKGLAAL